MNDRRTASTSLSANIIRYLRGKGHTQAQIAKMLHVSEGYVSLVKHRERSLTLNHLELLAAALRVPLGALLIATMKPPRNSSKQSKERMEAATRLIRKCDEVRELLLREPVRSSRKSA